MPAARPPAGLSAGTVSACLLLAEVLQLCFQTKDEEIVVEL